MANQYRSVLASGGASTGGDALPAEVLAGKTFTNDNGAQTGTMPNRGAVSQTLQAGQSYTIPEGYHNGSGTVTATGGPPFGISGNTCLHSQASGVALETVPTDSGSAISGTNWAVIVDATAYSTATMTGDISTNFAAFGFDEDNNTWTLISPNGRNWSLSGYDYAMVKQISSSAAKVYFTV